MRRALAHVGFALCGAALGLVWVERDRLLDAAGEAVTLAGEWWFVTLPTLAFVAAFVAARRSTTPKSAAHPTLQLRRHPSRPARRGRRPLGRGPAAPNVFVDGDSFARAAWPGADLPSARRWTVDASERVASRFGTDVAVVVGPGADVSAGRDHVHVVSIDDCGSMREALWELVAPVDPRLPMLLVTDDPDAAHAAQAHGVGILSCRAWMVLADRLTVAG